MLIEFFGKNFGCFRDEFRLSMLATDIDRKADRGIVRVKVEGDDEPLELLRCAAIYGPNASGKSTVVQAANSLGELLVRTTELPSNGHLRWYEPFALGPERNKPVSLGLKAIIRGCVYEYSVDYDHERFVAEHLIRLAPDDEVLIDRSGQDVRGAWTSDEQFRIIVRGFRPNALLLSLADRLAPNVTQDIAVAIRRLLFCPFLSMHSWRYESGVYAAHRAHANAAFRHWLLSRLSAADVGVVDLKTREYRDSSLGHSLSDDGEMPDVDTWFEMSLLHAGAAGSVVLPGHSESLGTQRLIELAPLFYDLAHCDRPRSIFVDEIDASMHPALLHGLVHHFNCELTPDEVKGQLVFTTHETGLMDDEAKENVLRRDQVYFTEKDSEGVARLYSLAEFRERNNLNLRRRYLQGRYGALPSLGSFSE